MIKYLILLVVLSTNLLAQDSASLLQDFKGYAERSYLYRMQAMESTKEIEFLLNPKNLLSANDLRLLEETLKGRYDLGKEGFTLYDTYKDSIKNYKHSEYNFLKVSVFLGAFLTMSDSYIFAYDQFANNYKIRRLLEEENLSIGFEKGLFRKWTKKLYSLKDRMTIIKALKIFDKYKGDYFTGLTKYIEDSYSYQEKTVLGYENTIKSLYYFTIGKIKSHMSTKRFQWKQKTLKFLFNGSRLFGNAAGLFSSRKGKLYQNQAFISSTKKMLKPLDVLVEKTPFRLTDKFIPGYWGHAAIYIGTEEQLKELGIWNHPKVKEHHAAIKEGRNIVEALRTGVKINDLNYFSNIDDFAVLRHNGKLSIEEKKEYLLRAISQVGKKYDFAFNVETSSKIVCSELHYLTFRDIRFDIEYNLGQPTISVDSIARRAMTGNEFDLLSLYIDGKEYTKDDIQQKYESLLTR